jgi:hypothetical protein
MKSDALPDGFPTSREEWEKLIATAPEHVDGPDCPYDPNAPDAVEAFWKDAVIVKEGGYPAVRAALAEKRRRGAARKPKKSYYRSGIALKWWIISEPRAKAGKPAWTKL